MGFAFLQFRDAESFAKAFERQGEVIKGWPVKIETSEAKSDEGKPYNKKSKSRESSDANRISAPVSTALEGTRYPSLLYLKKWLLIFRVVFVGNLSDSVTDERVIQFFSNCGELIDIYWMNDSHGRFKGTFYCVRFV